MQFHSELSKIPGLQCFSMRKCKCMEEHPGFSGIPITLKWSKGFLVWYHLFVPNFSQVAEPFNACKQDGGKFWQIKEWQVACETFKRCLVAAPILEAPNLSSVISTDTRDVSLGSALAPKLGWGRRSSWHMAAEA